MLHSVFTSPAPITHRLTHSPLSLAPSLPRPQLAMHFKIFYLLTENVVQAKHKRKLERIEEKKKEAAAKKFGKAKQREKTQQKLKVLSLSLPLSMVTFLYVLVLLLEGAALTDRTRRAKQHPFFALLLPLPTIVSSLAAADIVSNSKRSKRSRR
jgi:hypothetical protein